MKKVSIKDVAREAGVSITTVSRALNGYSDVSEKTKARIQEIVERMDYAPDANARAMGSKETTKIGLLISSLMSKDENGFIHGHLSGLYRLCTECDCEFVLLVTETEQQKMLSFRQLCKKNNLSGIVVTGLRINDPYYEEMMKSDIPCAVIDMETRGKNKCNVTMDNIAASQEAVGYLIGQGHRNIAMLGGSELADVSIKRYAGYRGALIDNDIVCPKDYVCHCDFLESKAYEETKRLLSLHPEITAFFCASDMMALGAIRAAIELEIQVPEQLSVMGYDDIPVAQYVYNGLSTVHQDPNRVGYEAGRMVYRMMQGEEVDSKVVLPYNLVIRGTTGPVRRQENINLPGKHEEN